MCLYTDQLKPQIAKKDIKVYKCLREGMMSPVQKFYYTTGEIYEAQFTFELGSNVKHINTLVTEKTRNAIAKKSRRWKAISDRRVTFIEITHGLHSCLFKNDKIIDFEKVYDIWYNAIVPAGSEFYVSPLGDIVSNRLVVTSKCE